MKQSNYITTVMKWTIIIAVCYLLFQFSIFKYIGCVFGAIVYLFIGFIISLFAGDSPRPWLERHPGLLNAFHISIIFLWLPMAGIMIVWLFIQFILEMLGIRLHKEEK